MLIRHPTTGRNRLLGIAGESVPIKKLPARGNMSVPGANSNDSLEHVLTNRRITYHLQSHPEDGVLMEKNDGMEERHGAFGLSALMALTLMAIAFYFLMLGPAIRWHPDCPPRLQTAIEVFYSPLKWLHEHTALETPLDWYAELWSK